VQPVLDVVDTNQAAIRLYHRLGWTHLGSYEQAFHDGNRPELLHCFAAPRLSG
jgi:RimJ/RimL family protein N-acetyltransferase